MATIMHILSQAVQEVVTGNIKGRNGYHPIFGEVRCLGENKIDTQIRTIERAIHLLQDRDIVGVITEGHEADSVARVVTIKDCGFILVLEVDDMSSYFLQFMCGVA